ncbi:MAG: DNA primase, partial [Terrimicrobiaceae bacterium]|nr:DNA primase [Terrimicrobiaceae bacterium]
MARISEETIRRVAEATDIVELISSYFPLKRAGSSYRALCPFHSEKTPSFHVNPARQAFHCFGCGAGGTVFKFVMDYEQVPFAEAVRRLAARANIPVVEESGGAGGGDPSKRLRLLAIHAEAARWLHHQLLKSPGGAPARDYLQTRGVDAATAKEWQLGYAPDSWDALLAHLRSAGFTDAELLLSGLAASKEADPPGSSSRIYSRFRGRLMFPICNDAGEVIAFSGRLLDPAAKEAKYVNSPETPLFSKGRVLFGLHKAKRALIAEKTAVVCEGQLDVIAARAAGVANVIAPQGTAFTDEQARLLARFAETVVLCFDSDAAGQEAAAKSLPALLARGLAVRVARLPEGHDPDSLVRERGAGALRGAVSAAREVFDHALDRIIESGAAADASAKARAARSLAALLAHAPDPVFRESTAGRICARLGIAPSAFLAQIRRASSVPQNRETVSGESGAPAAAITLSESMKVLCRCALHDADFRQWLAAHGANKASAIEPGGALLERIAAWPGDLSSHAALTAFAASLPPE